MIPKFSCTHQRAFFSACINVACIPSKLGPSHLCLILWGSPDQPVASISSTWVQDGISSKSPRCPPRTQKMFLLPMHEQAFPSWCSIPTIFEQNMFELSLPEQTCKVVSVHIPLQRNHWFFDILAFFWAHSCRFHMFGHSDLGSVNSVGVSLFSR